MAKESLNFIQWKGTDVCMDFWCKCGGGGHFDGYFAYTIKCPDCGAVYQLKSSVEMTELTPDDSDFNNEHLEAINLFDDVD